MVKKTTLYNSDKEKLYPRTSAECVGYGDGTVKDALDNTGVGDYPTFSESTAYSAGDVVNYQGRLYKFTADHAAGAWTGTDAEETDTVKAHIVQDTGDDENAVMSQKATTDKFTELEGETNNKLILKLDKDSSKETSLKDNSDVFYFCDSSGNVIFYIDVSGGHIKSIYLHKGDLSEKIDYDKIISIINTIKSNKSELEQKIEESKLTDIYISEDDGFIFSDKNGNVICKINKDGVHSKNIIEDTRYWLGKEFFVVGDSVCSSKYDINSPYRNWIPKFAELTGAYFDLNYNSDNISVGGTQTIQGDAYAGQMRLRKLLSEKEPKIIFYENINDSLTDGDITDESFMMSEIIDLTSNIQTNQSTARTYFQENIQTITDSIAFNNRKHGIVLRQPYYSNGVKITISGSVTKAGTIEIQLQSSELKGIYVNVGDSIETIVNKFVEYNYTNWDDAKFDNSSVVFSPNNPSVSAVITELDAKDTGLILSQETVSNAIRYESFYFISHDLTNWNNVDYWKLSSNISYYSKIKGVIEYVQTNAPNCLFILLGFPRFSFNFDSSDNKRTDGTYDIDKFKSSNTAQSKQLAMQKEIAEYMQVKFANVPDMWGISVFNASSYFNNSNVHPKVEGYDHYANSLYKLLFNF